mmetsp:Transcript_53806/g.128186  ORF Transcript_53806/g.128186 Transcript_53806/m.128186 type:complete len:266 (-) Transcript_53806:123-920(-)
MADAAAPTTAAPAEADPPLFAGGADQQGGDRAAAGQPAGRRQDNFIEQAMKAPEGLLKGANQAVNQVHGAVAGIVGGLLQPGRLSQAREEQVRRDERGRIQEQIQIEEQLRREEEERRRREEEERRQQMIAEKRSRWEQDWWLNAKDFKVTNAYKFRLHGEIHQVAVAHQDYAWIVMCDEEVVQTLPHARSVWGRDNCQMAFKVTTADEKEQFEAVLRMLWTTCGMRWRYELEVNSHVVPPCWSKAKDQRKKQAPEVPSGDGAAS